MATRLCQCTCMCGYYNANEQFGSKDMISGVHYRCFCQPRSVPLSLLAGSAQPIAGLCHLHAGHSENTNSPYMPSKMKNSSLISATHNKKNQEILKIEEEWTNPCLQRVSAYIATLHMGEARMWHEDWHLLASWVCLQNNVYSVLQFSCFAFFSCWLFITSRRNMPHMATNSAGEFRRARNEMLLSKRKKERKKSIHKMPPVEVEHFRKATKW